MSQPEQQAVLINHEQYYVPNSPTLLLCISGLTVEQLLIACSHGWTPVISQLIKDYGLLKGRVFLPTVSTLNLASIITCSTPNRHGIVGNSYYDSTTGRIVSLLSPKMLDAVPLSIKLAQLGKRVAMLTTSNKLYNLITLKPTDGTSGLLDEKILHQIIVASPKQWKVPPHIKTIFESIVSQYKEANGSAVSSSPTLWPMYVAVELFKNQIIDHGIVVIEDTLFHYHHPNSKAIHEFMKAVDTLIGSICEQGVKLGLVSDHGMSLHVEKKHLNIVDIEPELIKLFGPGFKVISPDFLPGVDQSYLSHGVFIYLPSLQPSDLIAQWLLEQVAIEAVYDRRMAVNLLHFPPSRTPDLVVFTKYGYTFGSNVTISSEGLPIYGHGGRYEEMVPIVLNFSDRRLTDLADIPVSKFWPLLLEKEN